MRVIMTSSILLGVTIAAIFYVSQTFTDQPHSNEPLRASAGLEAKGPSHLLDEPSAKVREDESEQPLSHAPVPASDSGKSVEAVELPATDLKWPLPQQKEGKEPLQGLFETDLNAELQNGKVEMVFSLKNISGEALRISHGSGQQFDISVRNEHDEEVYRWSYGKAFTQALIERGLRPGEQLTYHEAWPLVDNDGNRVPAGQYTVKVEVLIGMEGGTIDPDEWTAEAVIALD
ncbi:hypothetical protein DUZ99_11280 [Xylanibacillus composti]|uniref:Intracellular proteinase inhibitor BsuPI domain-containing protein n=1 Tax=Xylanibacillus composti TaxID=1572762 RepID=A0A8J4H1E2_9BACL|nr:BsuPI-related putative proteinase inhibitor [Xylanibacillus composti]MDT9725553.1 hypothetical protein [Xylanibacillus composti]GIQ67647.1 hypothetical protein XYCOK13_04710 [Xylanibacillus composti]